MFTDLAKVAREVDRRKADGARGHPVRGGAEEQAQVGSCDNGDDDVDDDKNEDIDDGVDEDTNIIWEGQRNKLR